MKRFEPTQTVPLVLGEDGTIRVRGSRVTLDSVIDDFKQGATAEQIQEDFPSITLRDVYGAIAYYLDHAEDVERYLREQEQAGETTRRLIEAEQDVASLRRRIRERRNHLVK
jgi:uncharacterized protein (DUF433 family)